MLRDMGMMINRRRVCGSESLPYDAEIEYLESTGTQYINTGIKPNKETKLNIIYLLRSVTSNSVIPFGVRDSGRRNDAENGIFRTHGLNTNRVAFGTGDSTNTDISGYNSANSLYEVYFDKRTVYINDNQVVIIANSTWSSNYNIFLFGVSTGNTFQFGGEIRIYSCKIYNDSNLVRDFIPVRIGNVGYMYDKVSGTLFGNRGTGNFILGPDV